MREIDLHRLCLRTGLFAAVLLGVAAVGELTAEEPTTGAASSVPTAAPATPAAKAGPAAKEKSGPTSAELATEAVDTTGVELVTREKDEKTGDDLFRKASQSYQKENYKEAVSEYLQAIKCLESLGSMPRLDAKIEAAKVALSKAYYYWALNLFHEAQASAQDGDLDLAIENCQKASEIYPPAKERCEEAIAKFESLKTVKEYRRQVSAAAADPEKESRNYSIDVLMKQGQAFYVDGQWDKARDKFQEVLTINPYYGPAIDYLRRVYTKLYEIARLRHDTTRVGRLAQVAWSPIAPIVSSIEPPVVDSLDTDKSDSPIAKKLRSLILPHIEYDSKEVPIVIKHLMQRSKEIDPDQLGVNIVLRLGNKAKPAAKPAAQADEDVFEEEEVEAAPAEAAPEEAVSTTITLQADGISLEEAIKYICKSANLQYRIEDYAIVIASMDVPWEGIVERCYPIEKDALDLMGTTNSEEELKTYFTDRGIKFPTGSSVYYHNYSGRLIVNNTPENIAQIDDLIKELNLVDPQVLTVVKFVEVRLDDMEELGFEYHVSRSADAQRTYSVLDPTQTYVAAGATQIYTLETAQNGFVVSKPTYTAVDNGYVQAGERFTQPENDTTQYYYSLINADTNKTYWGSNDAMVRNAYDDPVAFGGATPVEDRVSSWTRTFSNGVSVSADVHAVDLATSSDFLASPRLTTMNGSEAVVRMVKDAYYPTEWGEAEYTTMTTNGETVPVFTPSIPEFGDAVEEGIVLRVTPQVDSDKYTISLAMNPVIQEMVGWTDYSYEMPLGDCGELYPNTLKMPIIEARTVETTVSCYDGETIVLGGVISDRVTEVDDAYPILGDLPLIGRMFHSKGKSSQKSNLLIFMTCRLVNPDGSPVREREERGIPPFSR